MPEIVEHTPKPVPSTFDLIGLTLDEMRMLEALLGSLGSRPGANTYNMYSVIAEAMDAHHREAPLYTLITETGKTPYLAKG